MSIKTSRTEEVQLDQTELTQLVQNYLANKYNGQAKDWVVSFEKAQGEAGYLATGVRQTKF